MDNDTRLNLICDYLASRSTVKHHIDSYNQAIVSGLNNELAKDRVIEIGRHRLVYERLIFNRPKVQLLDGTERLAIPDDFLGIGNSKYPANYWCNVQCEVKYYIDGRLNKSDIIDFMKIPCMVLSDLCNLSTVDAKDLHKYNHHRLDQGGYYIINGVAKAPMLLEKENQNRPKFEKVLPGSKYASICDIGSYVNHLLNGSEVTGKFTDTSFILPKVSSDPVLVYLHSPLSRSNPKAKPIPYIYLMIALGVDRDKMYELLQPASYYELTDKQRAKWMRIVDDNINYSGMTTTSRSKKPIRLTREFEYENKTLLVYKRIEASFPGADTTQKLNDDELIRTVLEKLKNDFFVALGVVESNNESTRFSHRDDLVIFLARQFQQLLWFKIQYKMGRTNNYVAGNIKHISYYAAGEVICWTMGQIFKKINTKIRNSQKDNPNLFDAVSDRKVFETRTNRVMKIFIKGEHVVSSNNKSEYLVTGLTNQRRCHTLRDQESQYDIINLSLTKDAAKNSPLVQVNTTTYGFICGIATPEGENIGKLKHLCITTKVSFGTCKETSLTLLSLKFPDRFITLLSASIQDYRTSIPIAVNGILCGFIRVDDKYTIDDFLVEYNRLVEEGRVDPDISCYYNKFEMQIELNCDFGRLMIPVLVNAKLTSPIPTSFNECIDAKVIRFIDQNEAQIKEITPNGEYQLIHDIQTVSNIISTLPWFNKSPAARGLLVSGQLTQSMSTYYSNAYQRIDNAYVMKNPQMPLVTTQTAFAKKHMLAPGGRPLMVAICSFGGYNQEDAPLFNRTLYDTGALDVNLLEIGRYSMLYRRNNEDNVAYRWGNSVSKEFIVNSSNQDYDYSHLDNRGIVLKGTVLDTKTVLIARYKQVEVIGNTSVKSRGRIQSATRKQVMVKWDDDSLICPNKYRGWTVENIWLNFDEHWCTIQFSRLEKPSSGNKYTNRYGQKGVISTLIEAKDLPTTIDGGVPDVLFPPHSLPSRATYAMMVELAVSWMAISEMRLVDATAYCYNRDIEGELEQFYSDNSTARNNTLNYAQCYIRKRDEVNTDYTPMFNPISIGMIDMYPLKHITSNKMHDVGKAILDPATSQPHRGVGEEGGVKFDEMQGDIEKEFASVGVMEDRMYDNSDGIIADYNKDTMDFTYTPDASRRVKVYVPKVFINIMHCMHAMNITGDVTISKGSMHEISNQ